MGILNGELGKRPKRGSALDSFIHEQGIEDIFPVVAVGLVNLYLFLFSEHT